MRLKNNTNSRPTLYYWSGGIGLGLIAVAVVCALLYANGRTLSESPSVAMREPTESDTSADAPSSPPTAVVAVALVEEEPLLPRLDFLPGSIEEACGLNDFMPYHSYDPDDKFDWLSALESSACWTALDEHISTINPYLWGETNTDHPLAFLVLENPLTFGRIFADPAGDLARVQDALSRSECLLNHGSETNLELKENCHADALLNYALVNRFCFDEGVSNRNRTFYWEEDNPTPEQDRFMWKQELEDKWVRMKCKDLDSTLALTSHHPHPELYDLLKSLQDPNSKFGRRGVADGELDDLLIELAARLGDDTAGLTQPFITQSSSEEGYKFGRFSWLLTSDEWYEFATKKEPSTDRFERVFELLAMVGARRPDPRDEIEFDWEFVARHLCEPPYAPIYERRTNSSGESKFVEKDDYPSCQEIVHELRQQDIKFAPLLQVMDKFEQVALELDVYE